MQSGFAQCLLSQLSGMAAITPPRTARSRSTPLSRPQLNGNCRLQGSNRHSSPELFLEPLRRLTSYCLVLDRVALPDALRLNLGRTLQTAANTGPPIAPSIVARTKVHRQIEKKASAAQPARIAFDVRTDVSLQCNRHYPTRIVVTTGLGSEKLVSMLLLDVAQCMSHVDDPSNESHDLPFCVCVER